MEVPPYMQGILAKSDGETLYEHTWHVLSRFAEQARLRSTIAERIESPRLWHRLYWACLLHDFGKVASGFQRMLITKGAERWGYRHEVGSLAFVGWLFDSSDDDYRWIVAAVVSHHKDAAAINEQYKEGGPAIRDVVAQLAEGPLEVLWQWLSEYRSAWIERLGLGSLGLEVPPLVSQERALALVRNHGVQQIEQALWSYRRFLRDLDNPKFRTQATVTLALRGITITADHSASAHVGPPPKLPMQDYTAVVERLDWPLDTLHAHQTASAAATDNAVLIAPTGSGKTESALFWTFGTSPQQVPRLFYALPYQASMNAMRERLERLFPQQVGLQHGRALQALYRTYIEESDEAGLALEKAKDQQNRTELNYYPVRIFSPYQMLKACYRLRGYESIVSDYFDAAFIFDEIHAYEPQRLALILTLMSHLRQHYGARFFVMSATLPNLVATALHRVLGDYRAITVHVNGKVGHSMR